MATSAFVHRLLICSAVLLLAELLQTAAAIADEPQAAQQTAGKQTIRCAIIGGLMDTGFWPAIARRFQERTGHTVEVVSEGPKHVVAPIFEQGLADLLTMHASDTVMNLVADGYGENPQPWARNDMVLIGPPDDPARVRGGKDAVQALQKIAESKSKVLLHASQGANEVLADLLTAGEITLDPQQVISLQTERPRELLQRAVAENAYTLVGRIPFLNGRLPRNGMELMVQGDPRLRRPYVVIVTTDSENPRRAAAQEFARFLRLPETQSWISEFGKGALDDQPLFYPVAIERP